MHNAPSVTYPVGRSRVLGGLLVFLWLAGAAALTGWSLLSDALTWRHALSFLCLIVCGMGAAYNWRQMVEGELCWDGQYWQWSKHDARVAGGRLTVCVDVQSRMLLRLKRAGQAPCWFWAERALRPQRWSDLRRAVYSRPKPVVLRQDLPETAVL
jgi:hypothetical protein